MIRSHEGRTNILSTSHPYYLKNFPRKIQLIYPHKCDRKQEKNVVYQVGSIDYSENNKNILYIPVGEAIHVIHIQDIPKGWFERHQHHLSRILSLLD